MSLEKLNILLVYPETPDSYWSMRRVCSFVLARAAHVPLPLITLAALLPREWNLRLVDMNVGPLDDADLEWADSVLISGMVIHREEIAAILRRCRAADKPAIVGGPFASSEPNAPELSSADAIFVGEAEGSADFASLVSDIGRGAAAGTYGRITDMKPVTELNVVPRYDLLKVGRYVSMSAQASRGCPHDCEFCDVTARFGRRPRYKAAGCVAAELQAIHETGFRGSIFFADDNFICDARRAREIVSVIRDWQADHGFPFLFYTQVDIGLAKPRNAELLREMVEAGFNTVFVGLETPVQDALKETGKMQNVGVDAAAACARLRQAGLLVLAGGIIGFDADGPESFDAMRRFVDECGMTAAMVGLLTAIGGTRLYDRLRSEGRLRLVATADSFAVPNFVPARMSLREELTGYRALLGQIYSPEEYFSRATRELEQWHQAHKHRLRLIDCYAAGLSFLRQGILSGYRRHYWRFILKFLFTGKVGRAFFTAVVYHHFREFARQTVIPRLDAAIAGL